MTPLQETITRTATALLGIKEIEPNQGWINAPEFTRDMQTIAHWKPSDEWCADTGKVIWYNSFPNTDHALLNRYFSANCVESWHNFRKSPEFKTSPNCPVPGALAIWELHSKGEPTSKGHMGVVSKCLPPHFNTIEGNTSATGSRTGNIIAENPHSLDRPYNPNGLNILGFVYADKIK